MIEVVSYRSEWEKQFQKEKSLLEPIFHSIPMDLYHIGSTSIKGCSAKPVIDLLGGFHLHIFTASEQGKDLYDKVDFKEWCRFPKILNVCLTRT
jgi:GrpB-like predicted nucleotidyltransferase (UPF0157 family)